MTPASLARKRSRASTTMTRTPSLSKASASSSVSFLRMRPWSTWTQIRRSPTARWTSVAATAESTPPERAHRTMPSVPAARLCSSTRRRISSTVEAMKPAGVQLGRAPAMPRTKLRRICAAVRRVDDFGVELDAVQAAAIVGDGGAGSRIGAGGRGEAVRQALDRVAVAHPDRLLGRQSFEEPVRPNDRHRRRPELLAGEGDDLAAQRLGHQVQAVADAQEGNAGRPQSRVRVGRARFVDAGRAAGKDDRLRLAGRNLAPGSVEGQQLRVHVQLAHAPRDQLAVLAAEVEHHHRVDAGRRSDFNRAPFAQSRPPLLCGNSSGAPALGGRERGG